MPELKDSIDFGKEDVKVLFNKIFYPTFLGMVFSIVLNVTDGIFVGRGVGSVALAAVNAVGPVFMIAGAIGLMFGMGGSVVASIHLSKSNEYTARIVTSQSVAFSVATLAVIAAFLLVFTTPVLVFFGCSETMLPYAISYTKVFAPFMVCNGIILSGEFFVRLDGSPKYAMAASIVGAVLNIILDYLFIFPFKMGVSGAALATGVSMCVAMVMVLLYLFNKKHSLHFGKFKLSTLRAVKHTLRNGGYMCKLGFSTALAQLAIAFMMVCGNNIFVRQIGDAGVAAFSVVCYLLPIVFMVYDGIAMAAQPIESYNHGQGNTARVREALGVALRTSVIYGLAIAVGGSLLAKWVVFMFIVPTDPAYDVAVNGLRLFNIAFVPMAFNLIIMGYFQSIEKAGAAMVISLLRSFFALALFFVLLPHLFGVTGTWLAVPASEITTFLVSLSLMMKDRKTGLPV